MTTVSLLSVLYYMAFHGIVPSLIFAIVVLVFYSFTRRRLYIKSDTSALLPTSGVIEPEAHSQEYDMVQDMDINESVPPTIESFYQQHFADQNYPLYWVERIWQVFLKIIIPNIRTNKFDYTWSPFYVYELDKPLFNIKTYGDFLKPEFTWDFDSHSTLYLKLLIAMEEEFPIRISGEEAKDIHNFKDLVNAIIPKLKPPLTILVTSTGNTCLSVMAAVLMNYLGKGRFRAFHAKSQITENINPFVFETLENNGVPDKGYGSKPWDESSNTPIDIVIALSDQVAGEVFPLPIKSASQAVWNVPNPSHITGSQDESLMLFRPLILI